MHLLMFTGENKPKNYLQLAGRCLIAIMFVTLLRFEFDFVLVIYCFNNHKLMDKVKKNLKFQMSFSLDFISFLFLFRRKLKFS